MISTDAVAMEDGDLLIGLLRRQPDAFTALVSAYQDRLFTFALRYLGQREEAEEALQDAFLNAYRALYRRLPPDRMQNLALKAWLYKVTLNACRNRARRHRPVTDDLTTAGELASDGADPALAGERAALRQALLGELARLPAHYRAAVVLHFVEGLPYQDVAAVLGLPVGTVKSHVHRGALLMRPGLADWWRGERSKEVARDGS